MALDVDVPWDGLERQRVPVPGWFTPRAVPDEAGWRGLGGVVRGVSEELPSSWDPRTWDWDAVGGLSG